MNGARAAAALLALAAALLPAAAGTAFGQDSNYLKRFIEEAKKKVPPIVVPPPLRSDLDAPRPGASLPLDFAEAKQLMGLDAVAAGVASRLPGGKLGIIDIGFSGLREWLRTHPEEAARTTYAAGAELAEEDGSAHGYKVYRVVRAIMPDVPVVLYRALNLHQAGNALLDGMTRGVALFNISLSWDSAFDVFSDQEDLFSKTLRSYLPQYETFAFISVGNARAAVHAWTSQDRNANGYVDFRTASEARPDVDGLRLRLRLRLQKGRNNIYFAWDTQRSPDADYALEVVAGERTLAAERADPKSARKGFVALAYNAEEAGPAVVRVKRLAGPESGVFMRLKAYPIGVYGDFNGLQSAPIYAYRENPFVIFVGSFGKSPSGFSPSPFSDIGASSDGRLHPHVLGPGQLRLDGMDLDGTSFSSPFITALYATRVGYNLKNLVQRSASYAALASGVGPHERSRWGIPEAQKVTSFLGSITGPTKIEEVSHRVDGDDLVIRFLVTRCCMESLTWYVDLDLLDPATRGPLLDAQGKPAGATVALRSEYPDFARHAAEARIPLASLAPLRGKPAEIDFGIRVRAWRNMARGAIKPDEAPAYRFTP